MIYEHAIPHQLDGDYSQLYVSFVTGDSAAALNGLQSCLASAQSWMSTNKLKLNTDKTEFLLIGNEQQRSKYLAMFPIEHCFTFCLHISVVCSSCFYHIRDLRRIRRHFNLDSAKLLATALMSSRLDY